MSEFLAAVLANIVVLLIEKLVVVVGRKQPQPEGSLCTSQASASPSGCAERGSGSLWDERL